MPGLDEIADKIPERNSGMKYGLSNPGNSQFSFSFKPSRIADESYFIEASNFSPGFSVIFSQTKQFPVCTTGDCNFQIPDFTPGAGLRKFQLADLIYFLCLSGSSRFP